MRTTCFGAATRTRGRLAPRASRRAIGTLIGVVLLLTGPLLSLPARAALFGPGALGDLALELFDSRTQAQLLGQLERTPVPVTPSPRARRLAREIPTHANPLSRAYRAIALGRFARAEQLLSEVRERTSATEPDAIAAIDLTAAEIAIHAGRHKAALELWRRAFAAGSDDSVLNAVLATSLWLADPTSLSSDRLDGVLRALIQDPEVTIDRRLAVRRVLSFARLLDGRYQALDRALSDYLKTRRECSDCPWDPNLPGVQRTLAAVRKLQGRTVEAEFLYKQALEWGDNAPRSQRADYPRAALQDDLARLYADQGRFDDARSLLQEAGVTFEQALPADPGGLAYLREFVLAELRARRFDTAETALARAEALIESAALPAYPWQATFLGLRATLGLLQGQRTQAEIDQRRALSMTEYALGPADPQVGDQMLKLANVFLQQGRPKEALARMEQALDMERTWPRRDPRREAHILFLMGNINLILGAADQSVGVFELAGKPSSEASTQSESAQAKAPDTPSEARPDARILLSDGVIYLDTGTAQETAALFEHVLELDRTYPDVIDPLMLSISRLTLGNLYFRQARYAEARPLLASGLIEWERKAGPDDPRLINGLNTLGLVNWKLGRLSEAEQSYSRATTLLAASTLSAGHRPRSELQAKIKFGLGRVYVDQEQYALALEQLQQGLDITRRELGKDHPLRSEIRGLLLSTERKLARQQAQPPEPAPAPPNQ